MYPKKLNRTLHVGKSSNKQETIKQLITDKLLTDYSNKNQLNANLIIAYVDDFFVSYSTTEGAVRALKEEIKDAVLKPDEEKQLLIAKLKQRQQRKLKEQQLKMLTNPRTRETEQHKSDNTSQIRNTLPVDLDDRRKSIYQVDGSVDEWAAIVKYDTMQFQKEQEEQRKLLFLNKQKIKDELDRQVAEKEQKKIKEKEQEQLYYSTSVQQVQEFEKIQEQRKEEIKKRLLQEKLVRDQQVHFEKRKKKEQSLNMKMQEEEVLMQVKEQLKAEEEQQKRKRLEQKEKFQLMLKQNENLRQKAKEEIKLSKEYEKKIQEQYIQSELLENEKKEKIKREREEKVTKLMSNYSEYVMKYNTDNLKKEELINDFWSKKNSEHQAFQEFQKKAEQKEKQLKIKNELQQQMQEKNMRYKDEAAEKRILHDQQIREQKLLKQQEDQRRNNIREMYKKNAEELKKQMAKGYLSPSPKRKTSPMCETELLQNKNILKKIANDSSIGISIKKSEMSVGE